MTRNGGPVRMVRCDNCGTANLDGSEYCDECGMKLILKPGPPSDSVYGGSQPPVYQPPSANDPFKVVSGGRDGGGVTNERGAFAPEGPGGQVNAQNETPSMTSEGPIPSPPSFTTST